MRRPTEPPIGQQVTRVAKVVERAFDDTLAAGGGSRPVWLILRALMAGEPTTQRELADAVGIRGATLTHHLNAMEADGLVVRTRRPENRRLHRVELTEAGKATFLSLAHYAQAYDRRLRAGLTNDELSALRTLLERLAANVSES